ncbi:MAG: hypothetical protein H6686_13070 [Fibrobacteria bacterium]|nr:hypothetical protein [Fibrobacteria bacterium]
MVNLRALRPLLWLLPLWTPPGNARDVSPGIPDAAVASQAPRVPSSTGAESESDPVASTDSAFLPARQGTSPEGAPGSRFEGASESAPACDTCPPVSTLPEDRASEVRSDLDSVEGDGEQALDSMETSAGEGPRVLRSSAAGGKVVVVGQKRHKRKDVSRTVLRRQEVEKVVATAQDPLRSLPTLPGVSVSSDLSVRPLVRGGDVAETGVELDGIPLLMPYHFGSVFSVFHREALDNFQLYSGIAPARSQGMLSGTVLAASRPPLVDSLFGGADLSILRGSAWMNVPLLPGRSGLWISGQSLWYDWTLKRFFDLGALVGAVDEQDAENWKSTNTLPTTWDVQSGISLQLGGDWAVDFGGYIAGDDYRLLKRIQTYWVDGREVPRVEKVLSPSTDSTGATSWEFKCWFGSVLTTCPDTVLTRRATDTAAFVDLGNRMLFSRLQWHPDRDLSVEGVVAWQSVAWDVRFPGRRGLVPDSVDGGYEVVRVGEGESFDWRREVLDFDLSARKTWSEEHRTDAGFGLGLGRESARTDLARPVAQMILGTSGNPMEFLGFFNEEEVLVTSDQHAGFFTMEKLQDLDFRFDSTEDRSSADVWVEHSWDFDDATRVRAGLRVEEGTTGWGWPDPRLQVQHQIGSKDLVGIGLGLHTQTELPFEWRLSAVEPLVSEKSWLAIVEWEHEFAPGWRSTISGWGKFYQDLASPSLERYGEVDSAAYLEELRRYLMEHWSEMPDSLTNFSCALPGQTLDPDSCEKAMRRWERLRLEWIPAPIASEIHDWVLPRRLRYTSTGIGWAAGVEASLRFQPTRGWTGWASGEWSVSRRRDRPQSDWIPFALQHPWKFSLVNAFRIDRVWELSVRYAALGGPPYTPFKIWDDQFSYGEAGVGSDTLLWIGKRNSATLAPYQRLDLRVSRSGTIRGKPATFYYEIWNAWNDPNMILRDSESGRFRWVDWNVPIPVMFLGLELRL